jgi:hypothetical protein
MARNVDDKSWSLTPAALYLARHAAWEMLKQGTTVVDGRLGIDLEGLSARTKLPRDVLRRQVLGGWEDAGANKLLAPQAIAGKLPKVQTKNMGWVKAKLEEMHVLDRVLRLPADPFKASDLDPKIPRPVLRYLQKEGLISKVARAQVKGRGGGVNVYRITNNYINLLEYLKGKNRGGEEDETGEQGADREGDQPVL